MKRWAVGIVLSILSIGILAGCSGKNAFEGDWIKKGDSDDSQVMNIKDGRMTNVPGSSFTILYEKVGDDTLKITEDGHTGAFQYNVSKDGDTLTLDGDTFFRKDSEISKKDIEKQKNKQEEQKKYREAVENLETKLVKDFITTYEGIYYRKDRDSTATKMIITDKNVTTQTVSFQTDWDGNKTKVVQNDPIEFNLSDLTLNTLNFDDEQLPNKTKEINTIKSINDLFNKTEIKSVEFGPFDFGYFHINSSSPSVLNINQDFYGNDGSLALSKELPTEFIESDWTI